MVNWNIEPKTKQKSAIYWQGNSTPAVGKLLRHQDQKQRAPAALHNTRGPHSDPPPTNPFPSSTLYRHLPHLPHYPPDPPTSRNILQMEAVSLWNTTSYLPCPLLFLHLQTDVFLITQQAQHAGTPTHTHVGHEFTFLTPSYKYMYLHACVCIYIYCCCNVRHNTLPCSLRRGNPRTGITVCVCVLQGYRLLQSSVCSSVCSHWQALWLQELKGTPKGDKIKKQKQKFKQPSRACVYTIWSTHLLTSVSLSCLHNISLPDFCTCCFSRTQSQQPWPLQVHNTDKIVFATRPWTTK